MCLNRVHRIKIHKKVGWKIFHLNPYEQKIYSVHTGSHMPIPLGEWMDERSYRSSPDEACSSDGERICASDSRLYPFGFHIYKKKSDALKELRTYSCIYQSCYLFKVEFDEVVAAGSEDICLRMLRCTMEIIVARRMRVIQLERI